MLREALFILASSSNKLQRNLYTFVEFNFAILRDNSKHVAVTSYQSPSLTPFLIVPLFRERHRIVPQAHV